MQTGRDALSLAVAGSDTERSIPCHRTNVCPGGRSHGNKTNYLVWEECLVYLGGCKGITTRLMAVLSEAQPQVWLSNLSPTQKAPSLPQPSLPWSFLKSLLLPLVVFVRSAILRN